MKKSSVCEVVRRKRKFVIILLLHAGTKVMVTVHGKFIVKMRKALNSYSKMF